MANFLERKTEYSTIHALPIPVEQLYVLSYNLIVYGVMKGAVVNVVALITLVLSAPFMMLAAIVTPLTGTPAPNPVSFLKVASWTIVRGLNSQLAQKITSAFTAQIKKVVSEIVSVFPYFSELNLAAITLEDFSDFLGRVISDVTTITRNEATKAIFFQKECYAKLVGCPPEEVAAFVAQRENPTTNPTSPKYVLANKIGDRFRELGLTDEAIVTLESVNLTTRPVGFGVN